MMRPFLTVLIAFSSLVTRAQTVEEIDQLRANVLQSLEQYERLDYFGEETLNEDAVQYDTVYFYRNRDGEMLYMKWLSRRHYFHITGDIIDITEMFFLDGKAVFRKRFGYSFENPQWHREEDINNTKVAVAETNRNYYKLDGSALADYEGREAQGIYERRFSLLDSLPLVERERLIWSERCDACIENDYLTVYKGLLEQKKNEE